MDGKKIVKYCCRNSITLFTTHPHNMNILTIRRETGRKKEKNIFKKVI